MCPLCPCSGTTAQYGGGGECVPYVPVVVLQHMQYGGGACVPYVPVMVLQHSMEEEEEHVSPMSL